MMTIFSTVGNAVVDNDRHLEHPELRSDFFSSSFFVHCFGGLTFGFGLVFILSCACVTA